MIDYILDYLSSKDIFVTDENELEKLKSGIKVFLLDNGIRETANGDYHKQYVVSTLKRVNSKDLKAYLIEYPVISTVIQIAIEYKEDGSVPAERKTELMGLMKELYDAGLGDKYIPAVEVNSMLR